MKRLFISFCCLLAITLASWAGPVSVKSGNAAIFKKAVKASVTFDYSATRVENQTLNAYLQSRGSDFVRDWPEDQKKAKDYFVVRMNKKFNKGMQLVDDSNVEYDVIVRPETFDMGNGGSAFFSLSAKAGGVIMSGTVEVLNHKTKTTVCSLRVDEVKGVGHPSMTVRIGMAYFELANAIYDVAKNASETSLEESASGSAAAITPMAAAVAANPTAEAKPAQNVSAQQATVARPAARRQVAAKKEKTNPNSGVTEQVIKAQPNIPMKKGEGGSFAVLKRESRVSLYVDYSIALFDNKSEADFITYMKTAARRKDLDEDFDITWEERVKPQLVSTFLSKVNEELSDEKQTPRLVSSQGNTYTLKIIVKEINDNGDMECDYLLVGTYTGTVFAVVQLETNGGHVGKYVGLMNDGFENAGEEFGKLLAKRLKKVK